MKERSEFDMNLAIRTWRENLSQSPQFRVENLDELETHLRDSIATMQDQRLTDEEVFLVATRRVGSAAVLASEFSKVNAGEVWLNRVLWMLIGAQLLSVIYSLSGLGSSLAVLTGLSGLGYRFQLDPHAPYRDGALVGALFALAQILAMILILALGWSLAKRARKGISAAVANVLRRPLLLVVAVLAGWLALLLVHVLTAVENFFVVKSLGIEAMSAVSVSQSLAGASMTVVQTLALLTLTALLARRVFLRQAQRA